MSAKRPNEPSGTGSPRATKQARTIAASTTEASFEQQEKSPATVQELKTRPQDDGLWSKCGTTLDLGEVCRVLYESEKYHESSMMSCQTALSGLQSMPPAVRERVNHIYIPCPIIAATSARGSLFEKKLVAYILEHLPGVTTVTLAVLYDMNFAGSIDPHRWHLHDMFIAGFLKGRLPVLSFRHSAGETKIDPYTMPIMSSQLLPRLLNGTKHKVMEDALKAVDLAAVQIENADRRSVQSSALKAAIQWDACIDNGYVFDCASATEERGPLVSLRTVETWSEHRRCCTAFRKSVDWWTGICVFCIAHGVRDLEVDHMMDHCRRHGVSHIMPIAWQKTLSKSPCPCPSCITRVQKYARNRECDMKTTIHSILISFYFSSPALFRSLVLNEAAYNVSTGSDADTEM